MVEYASGRSGPNGQEWTNWTGRAIAADLLISGPYSNAPLLLYSVSLPPNSPAGIPAVDD